MEKLIFKNGSVVESIPATEECIRSAMKFILDTSDKTTLATPIEVGLKIEVKDNESKELQSNEYIQNNFKLNIKRLNRWWYSVYFDKKGELNEIL